MSNTPSSDDVKVIKANYSLQARVGSGPLDENTIKKCQSVMDNNKVDFEPMAMELLAKLKDTIKKLSSGELEKAEGTQLMRSNVMELKANAGTFGYELIGNLANIMLTFLEAIKVIDNDVIEIVDAHHKTLTLIVTQKMKGDCGEQGKMLQKELKSACKRYFDAQKEKRSKA